MKLSIIIPSHKETDISHMENSCRIMFPDAQIITSKDEMGRGKGWAIRWGLAEAHGDTLVFIDGDLDIHAGEIYNLLPFLTYYDVVIGIKDLRKLPPRRKLVSFGYRLFVRLLFRLHIADTQTGLKIWKRKTMPIFETDGFAYDIEMLVAARKAGLRIKEVPINCRIYSKVKLSSIIKTFWETIRIWYTHSSAS